MAQSLSKILLHIVFSTKNRKNLIIPVSEKRLHAYIATICRNMGSQAYRVGGTEDHVHIACTLPRTLSTAKLLEQIKTDSSKFMKREFAGCPNFDWQDGYAAFSLGQSQLNAFLAYIDRQKEHHGKISFKQEILKLFKRYEIEYDERYLWD